MALTEDQANTAERSIDSMGAELLLARLNLLLGDEGAIWCQGYHEHNTLYVAVAMTETRLCWVIATLDTDIYDPAGAECGWLYLSDITGVRAVMGWYSGDFGDITTRPQSVTWLVEHAALPEPLKAGLPLRSAPQRGGDLTPEAEEALRRRGL